MMDVRQNKAVCYEVNFVSGSILTEEMLSLSSLYPVNLIFSFFEEVDNCVLFGLDVDWEQYKKDGEIVLCPGIIKYCGKLYLVDKHIAVKQLYENIDGCGGYHQKFITFVIVKDECEGQKTVVKHEMVLRLLDSYSNDGVCIGAINLDSRPELPKELPEDIRDWNNKFSLLDVSYWSFNGLTYHPEIFRLISQLLMAKEHRDVYDNCFLMQLQASKTVGMGVITSYIDSKGMPLDNPNDRGGILCQLRKTMATTIEFNVCNNVGVNWERKKASESEAGEECNQI